MTKSFLNFNLAPFDYFLIVGVWACTFLYSYFSNTWDVIAIVATITGIINVVLCAKGSILNYIFGLINVSLYAYISFKSKVYGDFALNLLYYVPMQFVGWWSWKKRGGNENYSSVKVRKMTTTQRILGGIATVVIVAIVAYILKLAKAAMPIKDALTTILSVIAMLLMVKAFMEQWVLWILVNLVSVVIWLTLTIKQEPHAALMLIMWLFYTANSINGFIVWLKLSKELSKD